MNILIPAFVFVLLACSTQGEVGAPCTEKSQCAATECCQIINIIVASKKRQLLAPATSGTCQPYQLEGAHCDGIAVMNGYCGCTAGLTCRTIHQAKRGALPPGYVSLCLP